MTVQAHIDSRGKERRKTQKANIKHITHILINIDPVIVDTVSIMRKKCLKIKYKEYTRG